MLLLAASFSWAKSPVRAVAGDTLAVDTSKTQVFQGYSGGMMLHAGYLFGRNPSAVSPSGACISPQGMTTGIGGSLRINLWKYLRVGCEGYVSTMKSGVTDMRDVLQSGSYVRTGSGGLLADACWRMDKWNDSEVGATVACAYDGTLDSSGRDNGYLVEIAVSRTSFDAADGRILINFAMSSNDASGSYVGEDAISASDKLTSGWIEVKGL